MANEKQINSRIQMKHDTEANWYTAGTATKPFIPKQGEIIIYDSDDNYNYARFKIGDGKTNVNKLAFTMPAKVSQLENDRGYLTGIPSEYITESELAAKKYLTSVPSEYVTETELANKKYLTSIPSEYITETELNNKGYLTSYTETDPTVPSHVKAITEDDISSWNAKSEFSGNYNDLTNKPTIPSAYTHPSSHPASMITGLATVATSGKYSDLSGAPTSMTPTAHNQASNTINAMTGYSKPSSTGAIGISDTLNAAIGKLEKALDGKQASGSYSTTGHKHTKSEITDFPTSMTPTAHNQAANTINAMTGYSKPSSTGAIAATDTLNAAIGKLEKALDGKQASGSYSTTGHKHTKSEITDFPALATVATSGSYNDLSNKPTIPAAVTVDSALSSTSTNPVQNKVINSALAGKAASSHGTHVPTLETANNTRFLRNDNTWQTVTPANIGAAASSHTHSYLPLTGGTMYNEATITLSTYGTRSVTLSGNSITADMSKETGGWAGAFASVIDPSSTTTTMLGWYGNASELTHIFMGGTYYDPAMKMTPAGQFTFKNAPKVGTTDVALATAATQSAQGLMSAADKKKLDGIASGANAYSLPAATSTTLGGVKVTLSGTTLTISTT